MFGIDKFRRAAKIVGPLTIPAGDIAAADLAATAVQFGTVSNSADCTNIDASFIQFTYAGADTEVSRSHVLGRTPQGFIPVSSSLGGVNYNSGTAWTSTSIYLKNTVASDSVALVLF